MRGVQWAFVLAAAASGLAAAPGKGPVVTEPDWLKRPTAEDMAQHYPGLASRLVIEGRATIACKVDVEGALRNCEATSEAPAGLGFGAAALAMSSTFKMRPQMLDGKPVDGGAVRIPIRFTLPKDKEPAAQPPAAGSDTALRAGLRLVDAFDILGRTTEGLEAASGGLSSPGVSEATRQAAADAIRKAARGRREDLRDAYARAFASVFTDEEMTALADYATGPGKRIGANTAITPLQTQARVAFNRDRRQAAHDQFCAGYACGSAADLAKVWRPIEARDGRLDAPQWETIPSAYALRRAAPALNDALGLSGAVRMTCKVDEDARLEGCDVDEELPKGLGFGDAALKVAPDYKLSAIQAGAGARGRKVTVRVGFTPSTLAEPAKPSEPRSARALELARAIFADEATADGTRRDAELEILRFQSPKPKGVGEKVLEAAGEAYRSGSLKALDANRERQAQAWAAAYNEADLEAIAAFRVTPAARAQRERQEAMGVALGKALAYVLELVTQDARKTFCAGRVCDLEPAAAPAVPGK